MKKSTLFLAVSLVVTSAFPAVKSFGCWPWQRSPEASEPSRIARMLGAKTEEEREEERARKKQKSRMDNISKHLKHNLEGPSQSMPLSPEQKIHVNILKGLLSGTSREKVLRNVTPSIQALYSEESRGTNEWDYFGSAKEAISERLKDAESRFSPSSHLFGGPKAFSSRDIAQTLKAAVISAPQDDSTPSGQLKKEGLKLFEIKLDDKKTTGLQKRIYGKMCEELASGFKKPSSQRSIIRFLWQIADEEKRHDAKHNIEKHLSEKLRKQFSKTWDQVHKERLQSSPSQPQKAPQQGLRKRKQKQD